MRGLGPALTGTGVRIVGWWSLVLMLVLGVVVPTGQDGSLSRQLCDDGGGGLARRCWQAISWLGNPIPVTALAAASALLALTLRRSWHAAVLIAVPYAATLTANLAKDLLRRPRPNGGCIWSQTAAGWSLPSGHAVGTTTGLVLVALVFFSERRHVRVLVCGALLVSTLVSVSRVVLGVHYLSDVVAGQLWGALWAILGALLIGRRRVSVLPVRAESETTEAD